MALSGTGSELSLSALATITADTTQLSSLIEVQSLSGGDIEMPLLAQVSGGPVLFRSNGTGGKEGSEDQTSLCISRVHLFLLSDEKT